MGLGRWIPSSSKAAPNMEDLGVLLVTRELLLAWVALLRQGLVLDCGPHLQKSA